MPSIPDPVRRQIYADATGIVIAAVRHAATGGTGTPHAVAFASPEQLTVALGVACGIIESRWRVDAAEADMTFDEYLTAVGAANASLT